MGKVFFLSQCIDYKHVQSVQFFQLGIIDVIHIGDIGDAFAFGLVDAVSQYGQILVHTTYGRDCQLSDTERQTVADIVQSGFGQSGELMRFEDIMVIVLYCVQCLRIGVDLHVAVLDPVEGSDVVNAAYVVAMSMSDEDSIEMVDMVSEHLLPEVRSNIDEYVIAIVVGDQCRRAESFVVRVMRLAYVTSTGYDGYSLRSTRT